MTQSQNFLLNKTEVESDSFLEVVFPYTRSVCILLKILSFMNVYVLLVYTTIWYLLTVKRCQSALKVIFPQLSSYSRDHFIRAMWLGVILEPSVFMSIVELRPVVDVFMRQKTLMGILTYDRLYNQEFSYSIVKIMTWNTMTAMMIHTAVVTWLHDRFSLRFWKQASFIVFFAAAHKLRLKHLAMFSYLVVSCVEQMAQGCRILCCFERSQPVFSRYYTKWTLALYSVTWACLYLFLMPVFFLPPSLRPEIRSQGEKVFGMSVLTLSLWLFYCLEIITMPLSALVRHKVRPDPGLAQCNQLDIALLPPPWWMLEDLRQLRARRRESAAASQERSSNVRSGKSFSCSLKFVLALKAKVRRMRQSKLAASVIMTTDDHGGSTD